MLTVLLLATAAAQDTWPADAAITDAARLQMTPAGLNAAANIASEIVPATFDVPTLTGGSPLGGFPGCLVGYYYNIYAGWIGLNVSSATITPSNGVLTLNAAIQVNLNTASSPMVMDLAAACISGDCDAYITPFTVNLSAPITMNVVGGRVVASIGQVSWSDTATGANVNITNCTAGSLISGVNTGLSAIGQPTLYDILLDFARDQVDDFIPDIVADLELAINDALEIAEFSTDVDLLGTTLEIDFSPQAIATTPAGVDVRLGGSIYADQSACIRDFDVGGSRRTAANAPGIATLTNGTHVGVQISTDIIDQGLYAVWRGGLLCQAFEGGELGGFSLDTGLLGLVGGASYEALFPETKPLTVRTVPLNPPLTQPSPVHDLAVSVEDLGLEFYAELDGRQARALALSVSPEVGLDVSFSNITGALRVDLALPDAYNAELLGDPMVPDADEVVANVEGIVQVLASTAISGALGDSLSFELPTFEGYGLRNLSVADASGGWTTAEAQVGTVTYNGNLGCDQGCEGSAGCSTPGVPLSWGGGLLALILLRRRR